jgi:amino acid adenylation domain-containing protein
MDTYPLLQSQLGVFVQCIQNLQSTQYNLPNAIPIPPSVDIDRLIAAWRKLIDTRSELRTRFMIDENGEPRQWSDPDMEIPIVTRQMSEAELQAYIQNGFVRPFNLLSGEPLFRIEFVETEKGWHQLIDSHHAITDGMSFTPVLMQIDINKAYMGEELTPHPYGLYQAAEDEVATFGTEVYEKAKAYYAEKFAGLSFSTLSKSKPGSMGKMVRRSAFISREVCDGWAKEQGVPVNQVFQAAFSHVLAALLRQEKVAYYTVNHGRMDKRLRECIGMFVRSVPILADCKADMTVLDFIKSFRTELMSTIRYGTYPFTHFCRDLQMTAGVSFNFQALADMEEAMILGEERFYGVQPVREMVDDDMTVFIFFSGEDYEIRVESSSAMNDETTLQMMANAVLATLQNMMAAPFGKLKDIAIVSEETSLLTLPKGDTLEYDRTETLVALFRNQAAKTPDATAVVFQDKQLTYREIDEQTDRLAAYLINRYKVQSEEPIGVMIERSELMVIYPLAIMKAGAAYMPLDFHFPADRLQYMCEDAGVRLILSENRRVIEAIPEFKGNVITSDVLATLPASNTQLPKVSANQLNVILYTSGSTGMPKGVLLEHHGIVNFCHWYVKEFRLTASDHTLGYANFGFDAHMIDIYPTLSVGACVYIISSEMRMDLVAMNQYMEENNINVAFMTTQVGTMFATVLGNKSLRLLSTGGEKMMPLKKPPFDFYNVYGPTECSLFSTYYKITEDYESSVIGRALDNYQLYVVDTNLHLVPQGAAGELGVAGEGVGRGYLHPAEKDAHKFTTLFGQRCYRTGDLVRWTDDGNIEFLGRIDGQVKLRGLRIELGEIESRASQYAGVQQVVAEVMNGQTLCLYYTASTEIDKDALKAFLAESLTDYMVPTAFMQLDAMPLTPNGKVNRKALPAPEISIDVKNVPPVNDVERKILDIARQLLPSVEFGVTDNLFALGMTSLLAMRFTMQISKVIKQPVTVASVMRYRNIRAILGGNIRIAWLYDEKYDHSKPLLIFAQGIVSTAVTMVKFDQWSRYFNILVIEPLDAHYVLFNGGEEFEDVLWMYSTQLDLLLPEDAHVAAFMGFSWGGKVAYHLARMLNQYTGQQPAVIMGDTYFNNENSGQWASASDIDAEQLAAYHNMLSAEELAFKFNCVLELEKQDIPMAAYPGHIIYLNALKGGNAETKKDNLQIVRSYAPDLEMIDFPDSDHDDLFMDQELIGKYTEILTKLLENGSYTSGVHLQ